MSFLRRWRECSHEKNSLLCAGLDPADHAMGRGEAGLPEKCDKREWAFRYIEAVAPYCAAIKPNIQYWKNGSDPETLQAIYRFARDIGLIVIDDSKLADIGATNESGIFSASRRADAVTIAPFAGNLSEAAQQGEKWKVGIIAMCLMSNPEYEREKRKLVPLASAEDEGGKEYVEQYLFLATEAVRCGIAGIVVGAPSAKNHITPEELTAVKNVIGKNMLVLCPGVGAQGGEADSLLSIFGRENVIFNVGRSIMFPHGSESTPAEQAAAAASFQARFTAVL